MNTEKNAEKTSQTTALTLPPHQKQFLTEQETCPMCETSLNFTHEIDKTSRKVKEEAYCPQCGVRARKVIHGLH